MEQRRFFLFFAISMSIWLLWFHFVVPAIFPEALKPKAPFDKLGNLSDLNSAAAPADALEPANRFAELEQANAVADNRPKHPIKSLFLGPADPDKDPAGPAVGKLDEFFIAADLSSRGAAIDFVELTDKKRYPAFGRRGDRVRVLGSDLFSPLKTFSLRSPEIDKQLGHLSLDQIAWEVVPETDPNLADRAATFRIVSPDGRWELTKHYELTQLTHEQLKEPDVRNTFVNGYEIKLAITVKNLSNQDQQLSYVLQGPVGVPLEDPENSYKYRDVRMGFLREDGTTLDESKMTAAEVVKKAKANKPEVWRRKIKYIGVDVLYFAALIMPPTKEVESAQAVVAGDLPNKKPEYSDVSVDLMSNVLKVPGKSEVTHEYTLFAGPKRKELIGQLNAMAVMDYGWFDAICRGMVWLLNTFHSIGLSYGIAIICLTALVRTLLMPISKHQAANAEKMKELQPEMMAKQKELEAKYGKNTEEYMRAAQELSKKQLGLMMSGCLPVFLQLPIFIALYRAIGSSIELRMEPFLWFENLASPDALFKLPFVVPWFGWTHFNLLPCISTGLMFIHQKLTMPPPTNEEQAQQQKMMSFMMIFMGAMFFRVPSGLCLYFIATNVWSMTERWIFQHFKKKRAADEELGQFGRGEGPSPSGPSSGPSSGPPSGKGGEPKPSALGSFWNKLQEAADNQASATKQLENAPREDRKKKKR